MRTLLQLINKTFGGHAFAHSWPFPTLFPGSLLLPLPGNEVGPFPGNKLPLEIRYNSSAAVFIKIKVKDTPRQASIQFVLIFAISYRLILNCFNIF